MSFATSPAPTNVTRGRRAGELPGPARHVRPSQPRRVLSPGPLTAPAQALRSCAALRSWLLLRTSRESALLTSAGSCSDR